MKNVQTGGAAAEAKSNGAGTRAKPESTTGASGRGAEEMQHAIAVAAYFLAERRSFEPGHELEDWLDAEAQVLAEKEGFKGFPA